MENLTEKVYECTLAVEAHMVCDLLSQAGISARVEGEFLQSGGGELPLGNLVKVRVDPSRAAEAREVIADWEKLQASDTSAPTPPAVKRARFGSPLWFLVGAMVGGAVAFAMLASKRRHDGTLDRNLDGRPDRVWHYDLDGYANLIESDDDFDGRFEWRAELDNGRFVRSELDADGDGRAERVEHFGQGVLASVDFYFASGGRIVKRQHFRGGLLDWAEFDDDGDGVFERRVSYDAHEEPKL